MSAATKKSDDQVSTTKKRPRSETPSGTTEASGDEANKKTKMEEVALPQGLTFEQQIALASSEATLKLLEASLPKLTDGLPKRELKLIVAEAKACEAALEEDLRILKLGLEAEQSTTKTKDKNDTTSDSAKAESSSSTSALTPKETEALEMMLESQFSPPDTHWTLSALLGRLRHELTTPLPPRSGLPAHREKSGLTQLAENVGLTSLSTIQKRGPRPQTPTVSSTATTSNDSSDTITKTSAETKTEDATTTTASSNDSNNESQFKKLEALPNHDEYRRKHETPDKLLAVFKKLSTHRSSMVFRRPVNPKEAPGYTDRIRFPMDLSLIRKLIMSKHIQNYEGILKQVHLIGHNCVKYNGRESDYALVTREFESVATEYVWNAVQKDGRTSRNASPMPVSSEAKTEAKATEIKTEATKS